MANDFTVGVCLLLKKEMTLPGHGLEVSAFSEEGERDYPLWQIT
jgi:hypothetical protein